MDDRRPSNKAQASLATKEDVAWMEYDYHNGEGSHERAPEPLSMFPGDGDDDTDDFEFSFKGLPTLVIRGQSVCGNTRVLKSTGLAVWSGDDMAKYLVKNRSLIQGKKVLELGSGTGVCGIVAHKLGAASVLWTDGDLDALENLRYNVAENLTRDQSSQCPQLIWGESLDSFREKHGTFDVILASDCIYMEKCVAPLWETIDHLMNESDNALLIYVNTCISQAPFEAIEAAAERHGFYESESPEGEVYLFHRKGS